SKLNEITYRLAGGKDTTEVQQQVFGAVIKGVDENFDWSFFKEHLKEGRLPNLKGNVAIPQLLISSKISGDLQFKVNDTVVAIFVKTQPVKKQFVVAGIYETGLEEFDKKFILGDLSVVQDLNDWGIKVAIEVADTMTNDQLIIRANIAGGNGNFKYD